MACDSYRKNQSEFLKLSAAKAAKSANPRSSTQIHELATWSRATHQPVTKMRGVPTRKAASQVRSNFIARHPSQRVSQRQATVTAGDSGKKERISRRLPRRDH